jgi:hypothetical protein
LISVVHVVMSIAHWPHAMMTAKSLQSSAPEPPPVQSDGHVIGVSPVSQTLLPQIA